jgi:membrane fusion protein (multidrug efflux system)
MQALVAKKERDLAAFAAQPRPIATIAAELVQSETWQRYVYATGSFSAVQDVNVTNEIEGKVTKIQFESGQRVSEGDVLVTLDTSVDTAELEALIADQRLNELQFERSKRLVADNTISKAEFDIAAAKRDGATATARAKAAALDKKTIRAPFSGILGIRKIDLGEYLDAGSEIVSLQMLSPIYLDFATPERWISLVSTDQLVEAEVQAYPGEIFHGKITAINPGVDRATRYMRIRASIENDDKRLRPGMFAEIRGTVPERDEVLTIPEIAVAYAPYGNTVFVIEKEGEDLIVSRRQIETGEIRSGRVVVQNGLSAGEQIVSAGHNKLRNGMNVRIDESERISSVISRE